jgi:hypothetical protein
MQPQGAGPGQQTPAGAKEYLAVQSTTDNNLVMLRLLSANAAENEAVWAMNITRVQAKGA